ncbi:MAG: metal ABC transporter ATP-binding protein [Gemmatimonadetes bacterium]|nr:metal ABC transporter ATP-binding protein [Gemmatimonadota bacterium]MYG84849.1 metal ABC transporter ATP-binding protein [Gemmatimonadota bacterium]MYJ90909.1 metal ABC transporter ATP-binding protein [Gemmatimonadota bacterium]
MIAPMDSTILRFENLTLGYDRHPAVHHLDYAIRAGSLVAVVGPNGAGKSTLLKGTIGSLVPLGGAIRLTGIDPSEIAYLPQQAEIDWSFPISVFDVVAIGLWRQRGASRRFGREGDRMVGEALDTVGLGGFERRPIGTLSGGQMQRALFARLLLQDARLILLDEPFTAIDSATVRDLKGLIRRWHRERRTVVAVLHDLDQVRSEFPETLLLAREQIAAGPTEDVLSPANLDHARRLTEAFDDGAVLCVR